jgi:glycerate 2-kinase
MGKKKVLLAPTAFKECCTSLEITNQVYNHFRESNQYIYKLPLSDGGNGFLDSIKSNSEIASIRHYKIIKWGNELIDVPVLIKEDNLYIESAEVVGLQLFDRSDRNPLLLNTSALGSLLLQIENEIKEKTLNIRKVIIGIGGTATNDLGLGTLSAFGLKLYDSFGDELPVRPSEYKKAASIYWEQVQLSFEIEAIIDVNSPLTGENGSSRIFAPQKGATPDEVEVLEQGFLNILDILASQRIKFEQTKLPGAGGGLAAGLMLFLGARIKSSEEFILNELNAAEYIGKVDYVVTGEGSFDSQTNFDKAVGIIIKNFTGSIVFVICGKFIGEKTSLKRNIRVIELMNYFNSEEESIKNFTEGIKLASVEVLRQISLDK